METVVLVLTDVQGSTRLWQDEPTAMDAAMARHHEIVHGAVAEHEGWRPVDQGEGDAVFAAFRSPTEAVAAVAQVQRQLAAEPWPTSVPLTVRIGVHVGEVTERAGNLYGDPVNRCARLRGLGSGGQTLLSAPVYELVRDKLPAGASVTDLGEHRMKDLTRPEHVWQLDLDGQLSDFPPLASLDRVRHNLPVQRSPLIGRERDLAFVLTTLRERRLVTLTGFGGMGKTRLSLQVAAELVDEYPDGVWFVDLAGTTEADAVPGVLGRAAGIGGGSGDRVLAALEGQRMLLVLDNLEQVLDCAPFIGSMLDAVPGLKVLATSREPLRLRGEQELALAPLSLPPEHEVPDAATLSTYAAVQLFVERALAVKADFAVTNDNAPAVAAICQRLDGHPLALELAAARLRMLSPQALLSRLDSALSVLSGGGRDVPERHQTLRATIAWSYDLLEPEERLLLDRMSVFAGDTSFDNIEGVCGANLDVFTALASLVEKSLVRTALRGDQDAYGLLVSVRAFASERLAEAGQAAALQERHALWFRAAATVPPPRSEAERDAGLARVLPYVDELELAWEHDLATGDAQRIASFPHMLWRFLRTFGEFERSAAVAAAIADADPSPTLSRFCALEWLEHLEDEYQVPPPGATRERAVDVAAVLDRPDTWRMALEIPSGPDRISVIGRLAELALLPHPADSPWPPDHQMWITDNLMAWLLQFIDNEAAIAAARRCYDRPGRVALDSIRLGDTLLTVGRFTEALEVVHPLADLGVVRHEPHLAATGTLLAARCLVALLRPAEALELLAVWRAELHRRRWWGLQRADLTLRTWALLSQGELDAAAAVVAEHRNLADGGASWDVVHHLTQRLLGREDDPDLLSAPIVTWQEKRYDLLPQYLSLRVEQAVRTVDRDRRTALLAEIEAERQDTVLPLGYQDELDRLRAEP